MNNKGFAITTILYGIMILFLLLLVSLLGILSTFRNNLEKLIDSNNGTRDIVTEREIRNSNGERFATEEEILTYIRENNKRGLYCLTNNTCKYYSASGAH